MRITSEQAWYATDTGERVPERHPLASFLIVAAGASIDDAELNRYPIYQEKKSRGAEPNRPEKPPEKPEKSEPKPAAKQIEKPPETKAIKRPPAAKGAKKPKR